MEDSEYVGYVVGPCGSYYRFNTGGKQVKSDRPWPKPPKDLVQPIQVFGHIFSDEEDSASLMKPWYGKKYRSDPQDHPEYWNDPELLMADTARATVEQVRENPMAGWGEWTPSGMMDQVDHFYHDFLVPDGAKVMEMGCGGGRQCWAWRAFRLQTGLINRLVGIDHAQGAIEVAKVRMPDLEFYCIGADDWSSLYARFGMRQFDVIYTLTCLQHNSAHKLKAIFRNIHRLLAKDGLLWMVAELTIDSKEYVNTYHPTVKLTPWVTDERGSHGTAAWWIGFIADFGFELLKYEHFSYVFRKIEE